MKKEEFRKVNSKQSNDMRYLLTISLMQLSTKVGRNHFASNEFHSLVVSVRKLFILKTSRWCEKIPFNASKQ